MPRETEAPRLAARPKGILSPQKGSMRLSQDQARRVASGSATMIPLNDDKQEKAVRFHSRQALHEMQLNQIKAAAASSPMRKRRSLGGDAAGGSSPRTPNTQEDEGLTVVSGNAVTPMKRVPILANFEEWMKMATDNKINAANSWNFALIDYFHDMSLLKEGDSVNFQKASCTLDGCVKIYTSRVDSVATETGKLLSGLADSDGNKKRKVGDGEGEDGEDEDGEEGEEGEDGVKKKSRKRVQRSSEATLATSFAQLQLKKMELEFSVDPLFKKASADFDEGGAKGLLLNHLTIDNQGRIVFDSSDDVQDEKPDTSVVNVDETQAEAGEPEEQEREIEPESHIDVESLGLRFFPDLARLDEQDICPSLKTFELGGGTDSPDIPFLKAPDDWKKDSIPPKEDSEEEALEGQGPMGGFDDDDDDGGAGGGFDVIGDIGFGEGGEAWAKEAAIETQMRPYDSQQNGGTDEEQLDQGIGSYEPESTQYGVHLSKDKDFDRDNILSYFDQALQKNWAGPQHWRIQKIKDASKPVTTTKRKEKEAFEIDFLAPMTQAMADLIYTSATSNSAISLPKSQWKSKTRNLLPDDKHFNSRQLLSLFLKPKARIGSRKSASSSNQKPLPQGEIDEAYWAREQDQAASMDANEDAGGNYDANFFHDDGQGMGGGGGDDDDDDFADARETFSPALEGGIDSQTPFAPGSIETLIAGGEAGGATQDGFGSRLVTQSRRMRPEYVQYARVASKVDVRRLKEEMWKGIGFTETLPTAQEPPADLEAENPSEALQFTRVMNSLQGVYPKQAMADISTSYCFICLLHLANEKGLVLQHGPTFEEISIRRDGSAVIDGIGD